jgi:predicted nucleotidyltransferase
MSQRDEILLTLKEKQEYIRTNFEVEKIGLFGSYAKNTQTENSDIDIYVEFKNKTFKNIAGLWVYLEELYKKKIDLVHRHKRSRGAIFEAIQKEVIYG